MATNEAGDHDIPSPLKVAMVVPPWYELPPRGYGGLEAICSALIDALCQRGHDVTVFGAGRRTGTSARFVSTYRRPQFERLGEGMPDALHAARVNHLLDGAEFDVIHDHSLCGPLTVGDRRAPTVVTVHGKTEGELGEYYAAMGKRVQLVAISDSQRNLAPGLNWVATVHNAINPDQFTPGNAPDGPVVWLGRFSPDKGPDLAINACRAAGLPLVLAGKSTEPSERQYLDEVIRPMLGPDVALVLDGDRALTNRLLTRARCLIMPVRWNEPFGMVMIEAMASGTPVVALRRGSIPEVVRHGSTGWVCDDPGQLPEALRRCAELDPDVCVAYARSAFGADQMARRYERVYRRAVADRLRRTRAARRRLVPVSAVTMPRQFTTTGEPAR